MSDLCGVSTDGVAVSTLAGKDCERSLVATRNMAAGDIVLAEDPFAASLLDAEVCCPLAGAEGLRAGLQGTPYVRQRGRRVPRH